MKYIIAGIILFVFAIGCGVGINHLYAPIVQNCPNEILCDLFSGMIFFAAFTIVGFCVYRWLRKAQSYEQI